MKVVVVVLVVGVMVVVVGQGDSEYDRYWVMDCEVLHGGDGGSSDVACVDGENALIWS